jgi:hypothetical protein
MPRKFHLFILLFSFASLARGQGWNAELFLGTSGYHGDLQQARFTFQDMRTAFGFGTSYDLNEHISFRGMLNFVKLTGNDRDNTNQQLILRNLNFQTSVQELSLTAHYNLFKIQESRFNLYGFLGLTVFHFNPYTYDRNGNKQYLQPLGTEGQGLSTNPGTSLYQRNSLAIPFGGGIRFQITDGWSVGLEASMRKTFTDYLDDVSGNYPDQAALLSARGPTAVELSYRSAELPQGDPNFPPAGTKRGSPQAKDWYYSTGLTARFRISGSGSKFGGFGKTKGLGCPTKVY